MRIGVFGGSFNPVHNGHLRLAHRALSELNLEKIVFVPSYRTPLKENEDLLPFSLRARLLRTALKGHPSFSLSLCEIERKGPSFTVDTLKYFKRKFGTDVMLFFLAGADTLKNLKHWKNLKGILRLARFVVMTRPGYPLKKIPGSLLAMPFDALAVSSSEIRNRLKSGKKIEALVPKGTAPLLHRAFGPRPKEAR